MMGLLLPTGTVFEYAGQLVPRGWLECDGAEYVSRDFPELFAAIGHTFGGVGLNFRVPDCRGRVSIGMDSLHLPANRVTVASGLDSRILGVSGGTELVQLATANMPSHDHGSATGNENSSGSNPRIYCDVPPTTGHTDNRVNMSGSDGQRWLRVCDFDGPNPQCNHTHRIAPEGGNAAHLNIQPSLVMRKIIFTGQM